MFIWYLAIIGPNDQVVRHIPINLLAQLRLFRKSIERNPFLVNISHFNLLYKNRTSLHQARRAGAKRDAVITIVTISDTHWNCKNKEWTCFRSKGQWKRNWQRRWKIVMYMPHIQRVKGVSRRAQLSCHRWGPAGVECAHVGLYIVSSEGFKIAQSWSGWWFWEKGIGVKEEERRRTWRLVALCMGVWLVMCQQLN